VGKLQEASNLAYWRPSLFVLVKNNSIFLTVIVIDLYAVKADVNKPLLN
jgi:hypothetical protein